RPNSCATCAIELNFEVLEYGIAPSPAQDGSSEPPTEQNAGSWSGPMRPPSRRGGAGGGPAPNFRAHSAAWARRPAETPGYLAQTLQLRGLLRVATYRDAAPASRSRGRPPRPRRREIWQAGQRVNRLFTVINKSRRWVIGAHQFHPPLTRADP